MCLQISVALKHIVVSCVADPDPESGAFLTPESGIRGGGGESGPKIRNEHFLGVTTLKIFVADLDQGSVVFYPESGMKKLESRDIHPRSATLIV
jgi:hypothetical protein